MSICRRFRPKLLVTAAAAATAALLLIVRQTTWRVKLAAAAENEVTAAAAAATAATGLLIFNRVPKTGSEMVVRVLLALAEKNAFVHRRYGAPQPRNLSTRAQARFVSKMTELKTEFPRLSYDRHVYFLNLINVSTAVWFSLIRDPVEKFISRFSYLRSRKYAERRDSNWNPIDNETTKEEFVGKNLEDCIVTGIDPECNFFIGRSYDLTIPYFCGHEAECQVLGSIWALQRAKANVGANYPVVGLLEDLPMTMKLLDKLLPEFFKGVEAVYTKDLQEPHTNKNRKKQKVSKLARDKLATNLTAEYDFYEYVKQRMHRQYNTLFNV